jgi:hypothetical protein
VEIPGLGPLTEDPDLGWHWTEPLAVPLLGGAVCEFALSGYGDDPDPEDFHKAIRTFLGLDRSVLEAAAPHLYAYYRDIAALDDGCVVIDGPETVLDHVRFGPEPMVERDDGDGHVHVSLEGGCDWEPEHGLQVVLRDGATVTKVGPYDGHLTNASAHTGPGLEGVIYRPLPGPDGQSARNSAGT